MILVELMVSLWRVLKKESKMLFSKKNTEETKDFVVVIGTSPLAKFLVHILQEKGVDVVLLSSLKNKELGNTYTLKSSLQNQSFEVKHSYGLSRKPEYCFLASSFDDYKSDLFFLSDVFLKDVPVINFASFYNKSFIEQMEQVDEVRAYFKGWLVGVKKEIYLLNRISEIKICSKNKNSEKIKELLSNKKTEAKDGEKNTQKLFWQELSSHFLANLCLLAYKTDISQILTNSENRKKIDLAISELAGLIKKGGQQIDEQKVLSDIYAFPDGYSSEFDSMQGVNALSKFVEGIDFFETPNLFEMVAAICKKY